MIPPRRSTHTAALLLPAERFVLHNSAAVSWASAPTCPERRAPEGPTTNHLYFWRLFHEIDQKASAIAAALADTISDLAWRGFTVCSVVTDNALNGVAVLNADLANSVRGAEQGGLPEVAVV
jgi:hypothetical protein